MDLVTAVAELIDRYGLPLILLIVLGFAFWRGWIRSGPDVDKQVKQLQDQLAYVEARRVEERDGRLELSKRLESNSETLRQATGAFKDANEVMKAMLAERGNA